MVSCVYKNRNINEYPIVTGSGLDPFRLFSDTLTAKAVGLSIVGMLGVGWCQWILDAVKEFVLTFNTKVRVFVLTFFLTIY